MLGNRLELCFNMIEKGMTVCDVGTDHGYLACELVKRGICDLVIASDINEGPLSAAKKNIAEYGYEDKIPAILSDGLEKIADSKYADKINCVVIAGMGGETIIDILEKNLDFSAGCTLILQPMTRESMLRKWLYKNGFEITKEEAVSDGKKVYVVLKAVYIGKKIEITEATAIMGFADYSKEESKKYGTIQFNKYMKKYKGQLNSKNEAELEDMKNNLEEAERILKNESKRNI